MFGGEQVALSYRELEVHFGLSKQSLVNIRRSLSVRNSVGSGQHSGGWLLEEQVRARSKSCGSDAVSRGRPRFAFRLSPGGGMVLRGLMLPRDMSASAPKWSDAIIQRVLLEPKLPRPQESEQGRATGREAVGKAASQGVLPAGRLLAATLWCLADDFGIVRGVRAPEIARLSGLTTIQVKRQLTTLLKLGYIRARIRGVPGSGPLAGFREAILLNPDHPELSGVKGAKEVKRYTLPGFDGVLNDLLGAIDKVGVIAGIESRLVELGQGRKTPTDKKRREAMIGELELLKREFARGIGWFDAQPQKAEIDGDEGEVQPVDLPVARDETPVLILNLYEMFVGDKTSVQALVSFVVCECAAEILNQGGRLPPDECPELDERLLSVIKALLNAEAKPAAEAIHALAIWIYGWALVLAGELSNRLGFEFEGNGTDGGRVSVFPLLRRHALLIGIKRGSAGGVS